MKIQCEVCEKAEAEVLCCSDEAVLCKPCDTKVHEANKLFQRHHRVPLQKYAATSSGGPLCDICQERKGYFFCLEDRALLCNDCDGAIHSCNSHQRFLLSSVQVSDQSLTENSGCSTTFSSETYQIQSKASPNSHYSGEEAEAGNSVVVERMLKERRRRLISEIKRTLAKKRIRGYDFVRAQNLRNHRRNDNESGINSGIA